MPTIYYVPDNLAVETDDSATILHTSLENGIPHIHVCGGNARCSTCRVMILDGEAVLPPRNEKEQRIAERLHFPSYVRLACQTPVTSDIDVRRLVLDDEDIAVTEQKSSQEKIGNAGIEKKIAIMFADIRNFTTFSETHVPYDVIHLLNRYYNRIGRVIRQHNGYIDNYIGDGIMALFGTEMHSEGAADNAVHAGLEMLEAVDQMRPYMREIHNWDLQIGVGIHYGEVVLGNIGERENSHETAIGDSVNFASRIESANKEIGSRLLVSEDTLNALTRDVNIGQTCHVSLKGKSGEHTVYEVLGLA